MCGISGFIDFNKKSTIKELKEMTDVLHHRGPDDSGYSFYENNNCNIGLGHRRLSILDLSKHGHQPMKYEDIETVYNGEVYNFKEIRTELEKYNYKFDSDSDTEVILKSYHKWGLKFVDKLNGMYAITIYDKTNKKLYLFRDRAGVKPLYWYWKNDLFMFSSELKSFHENENFEKSLNIDSIGLYLKYGYIHQPHTIFNNTYKLKSGHYLEIFLEKKEINQNKYWDVIDFYNKPKLKLSDDEAIIQTENLLTSSFNYRMVSDVPVGVFLSGGYDSSIVTAILQKNSMDKIKTFTIGFHEKGYDESPFAKKVADHLGTDHTEYYCTQKEALAVIPKLVDIYDEPFGDPSAIPTILVSEIARKDVTVALSADGGDEVFGGYSKYPKLLKYANIYNNKMVNNPVGKLALKLIKNTNLLPNDKNKQLSRLLSILDKNSNESLLKFITFMDNDFYKELLLDDLKDLNTCLDNESEISNTLNDELSKLLAIDYQTYMNDDVLTKVDRAGMCVSLEGREPLLDYRIIEYVAQLDSSFKIRNGSKKWLLKEITHKYIPKEIMDRPKMGFGVPLEFWFQSELIKMIDDLLNENFVSKQKIFNFSKLKIIVNKYKSNPNDSNYASILWKILIFQMWYKKWI